MELLLVSDCSLSQPCYQLMLFVIYVRREIPCYQLMLFVIYVRREIPCYQLMLFVIYVRREIPCYQLMLFVIYVRREIPCYQLMLFVIYVRREIKYLVSKVTTSKQKKKNEFISIFSNFLTDRQNVAKLSLNGIFNVV